MSMPSGQLTRVRTVLIAVLVLATSCAGSTTITEVDRSAPVAAASTSIPTPTPVIEPEPSATTVPLPDPDPTTTSVESAAEPTPLPSPAPTPPVEPVAQTLVASAVERIDALNQLEVGFVDPQKLNNRIDLGSGWSGGSEAELHQGEPQAAGPIPEVGENLHDWCVEGVNSDAGRAEYWSHRDWWSTNYELALGSPHLWTSVYASDVDARDAVFREQLIFEHCAGIELTTTYEGEAIDSWTHVLTVHTTPAGHTAAYYAQPRDDSGFVTMSLQAGPVVTHISLIGAEEKTIEPSLAAMDEIIERVLTAYETEFALAVEVAAEGAPEVRAASTEGGEAGVGDYPRAESPWVTVSGLLDLSDAPKIEASRVDSLLEEAYGDRGADFTADHRDCLALEIAIGERRSDRSVSSIVMPLFGRYCAPELHADWWADDVGVQYVDWWAEDESINLDDEEERRCLAHVVFQTEVTAADGGLLELTWPDLDAITRIGVLRGLSAHCGLSEADAVRAGMTPTNPLEVSAQLPAYCRAVAVHDSRRIEPPSMLGFFEKLGEIYADVDPPPGIADVFPTFVAFNAEVAELLAVEGDMDSWALWEHPAYLAARADYGMDEIAPRIAEFNRANCIK